jgi:hypothetical protein
VDNITKVAGIGNLQHTVQDIHDILKACYTVARKWFVNNVCVQGTDYYLVSGPETPLRVFSPFVGDTTSEQLEAIGMPRLERKGKRSSSTQNNLVLHYRPDGLPFQS